MNLALASSISTLSGLGMKSLHTIRDNKRREYFENKRKQKELKK